MAYLSMNADRLQHTLPLIKAKKRTLDDWSGKGGLRHRQEEPVNRSSTCPVGSGMFF